MLANDRIKCRAWNKTGQYMITWPRVIEYIMTLGGDDAMTNLVFMQPTGIHDSKGVTIYEGDIIADSEEPDIGYWVVVWSPITLAFMLGSLQHDPRDENYFKFENPIDYLEDNISPDDIVAGNIFENEELFNVNLE